MGSNDYLKLKPESATFLNLFLFTLSFNFVDIRTLADCPAGKERSYQSFGDRWIIVSSILLQKLLLAIANHLQTFKIIRAKIFGVPQETYGGKVKCGDWRIEVGKNNLKLGDDNGFRYYGALTMMASTLAYESPSVIQTVVNNCWKMNLLKCYDFWNDFQGKPTTQAFAFQNTANDPNVIVVAFRGSSELGDWLVDFNVSWYNIEGIGHIHYGFMQALGLQNDGIDWPKELPSRPDNHQFAYYTLRQVLRDVVKANDKARFIITGHSLGGALATLFVTILAFHGESALLKRLQAIYTFGQPRAGDRNFAQFMNNLTKNYGFGYYRYVYSFDMVARVPFDFKNSWYKHFGECVYYNSCYKGKFLEAEPNPNYFFEILLIPRKYLTAWWELLRSLVIPPFKGEGFNTLMVRLFGLLLPGASAHLTQNYINSTRYGKIQLPLEIKP
ncbi:triacylglycerol lipase [Cucumis melo var. makuwa]|uniref:Triacylglycerol lipase n=2 Tax=Cucumis melo TaxID=3656 RepID=A0A5D3D9F9_CUCMM|nr:triacylglycerol lipase [Cucumis melo var. makuwa]TYK20195.1 triacylglycerol lipase [Cucumis melo var. makuwa]